MSSEKETDVTNIENARLIQELVTTEGRLGSPIDLDISRMQVISLNPLQWVNYNVPPRKLKITNTGRTVVISAKWHRERPYLTDGPLLGNYVFSQTHFHWGENEIYGSEHFIDGGSMPMELHTVHYKTEYQTQAAALRKNDGVTILVYLFKLQTHPNIFLEEIINSLPFITSAHSSVRLVPINLTDIFRPFPQDYFVYWGSIVTPSWTNDILWLVSRIPIGISKEQIAEFRTLFNESGMPILENRRPVTNRRNRSVFHVCPSGSRYATLLQIPRDLTILFSEAASEASDRKKSGLLT